MGGLPRGVVIGTKVRIDPAQAKYAPATIRSSMEDSLARLRMDRVDLLQLHTSITEHSGRGVTVSDVLGPIMDGLEAVRDAGLASWVGITANGDTEAVREVVRSGRTATAQIMLNALNPSAGWAHHLAPGGHDFSGLIRDTIAHEVGVIVIDRWRRCPRCQGCTPSQRWRTGGDCRRALRRRHRTSAQIVGSRT